MMKMHVYKRAVAEAWVRYYYPIICKLAGVVEDKDKGITAQFDDIEQKLIPLLEKTETPWKPGKNLSRDSYEKFKNFSPQKVIDPPQSLKDKVDRWVDKGGGDTRVLPPAAVAKKRNFLKWLNVQIQLVRPNFNNLLMASSLINIPKHEEYLFQHSEDLLDKGVITEPEPSSWKQPVAYAFAVLFVLNVLAFALNITTWILNFYGIPVPGLGDFLRPLLHSVDLSTLLNQFFDKSLISGPKLLMGGQLAFGFLTALVAGKNFYQIPYIGPFFKFFATDNLIANSRFATWLRSTLLLVGIATLAAFFFPPLLLPIMIQWFRASYIISRLPSSTAVHPAAGVSSVPPNSPIATPNLIVDVQATLSLDGMPPLSPEILHAPPPDRAPPTLRSKKTFDIPPGASVATWQRAVQKATSDKLVDEIVSLAHKQLQNKLLDKVADSKNQAWHDLGAWISSLTIASHRTGRGSVPTSRDQADCIVIKEWMLLVDVCTNGDQKTLLTIAQEAERLFGTYKTPDDRRLAISQNHDLGNLKALANAILGMAGTNDMQISDSKSENIENIMEIWQRIGDPRSRVSVSTSPLTSPRGTSPTLMRPGSASLVSTFGITPGSPSHSTSISQLGNQEYVAPARPSYVCKDHSVISSAENSEAVVPVASSPQQ